MSHSTLPSNPPYVVSIGTVGYSCEMASASGRQAGRASPSPVSQVVKPIAPRCGCDGSRCLGPPFAPLRPPHPVSQVYEALFEGRFLRETGEFYATEGVRTMGNSDVPHFLQHVDTRLQQVRCSSGEGTRGDLVENFLGVMELGV